MICAKPIKVELQRGLLMCGGNDSNSTARKGSVGSDPEGPDTIIGGPDYQPPYPVDSWGVLPIIFTIAGYLDLTNEGSKDHHGHRLV